MGGPIIIAGLILSLLLLMLHDHSTNERIQKRTPEEKKTNYAKYRNMRSRQLFPYDGVYRSQNRLTDEVELLRRMQRRQRIQERSRWLARKDGGSDLVRIWRKSIAGLVRLAERNLESAKRHLILKDYTKSIGAADTSVENIARALIYCYGGKPNLTSGQEEALEILSKRFKGDEKTEFEETVGIVARIGYYKSVLKYALKHNVQAQLFDEASTGETIESASTVVKFFRRIIVERFGEEIPELLSCGIR